MKSTTLLLGLAVLVAGVLRGLQAGESLWLDELHTSWAVSGSLGEVAARAGIGNQSTLYFWLAWFFARLPVQPEIALRLPSLLAGCALPVAVFWVAKKLCPAQQETQDNTVPLLAAWLVVIDPRAIFYAQEARPYALLMLTAVAHFGLLLRTLEQNDWRARSLWVITGALLVHLNYTGSLILLAEFMALLLLAVTEARSASCPTRVASEQPVQFCLSCWIDLVALIVLLLPAIPGILDVATRRENWNSFVKAQPPLEMLRMFPWTPAIILLIVLNSWRPVISQRNLVLLSCWLLVPIGVAWTTTQLDVAALFHQRYLIAVLPASLLAAALCVRFGINVATQSAFVGIVLALAVANGGLVQNVMNGRRLIPDRREDWRGAILALNTQLETRQQVDIPVLVRSGLIEADALPQNSDSLFREYCLCPVRGMYRLQMVNAHPLTTSNPGKLSAELRQLLKLRQSFWLLIRTSQSSVREQLLIDLRQSVAGEEIWEPDPPIEFGNLYIQRIQLRKPLLPASD